MRDFEIPQQRFLALKILECFSWLPLAQCTLYLGLSWAVLAGWPFCPWSFGDAREYRQQPRGRIWKTHPISPFIPSSLHPFADPESSKQTLTPPPLERAPRRHNGRITIRLFFFPVEVGSLTAAVLICWACFSLCEVYLSGQLGGAWEEAKFGVNQGGWGWGRSRGGNLSAQR